MPTPIETMLDRVDWKPTEYLPPEGKPSHDGLPYETHHGVLQLFDGFELDVVQLNTGQRLILSESMDRLITWMEDGAK